MEECISSESLTLPEKVALLFKIFYQIFPYSHLLVTTATENKKDDFYYIFPECKCHHAELCSTSEQLLALKNGPANVVKIGSHEDHGITIGLVKQLFPEISFHILLLRSISPDNVVFTFSFICPGSVNRFEQKHVALSFHILNILSSAFTPRKKHLEGYAADNESLRYLPLVNLPGMHSVNDLLWHVSRQNCPVLLLGESGVGKEAVAETLYRSSARVYGPFVKVNCGSFPDTLIDSELFGHEKGAFTGAIQSRKGIFERANRGMLLLDEIGELPLPAQTKLLRVLQEGVLERIGGNSEQRIDVRIIAATHRNLVQMVEEGSFRADLFFRLNVFPIIIPPLRERPEDIPVLIDFLLKKKCSRYGLSQLPDISKDNMQELMAYPWPGNVRELDNALERAVILWSGDTHRPFNVITTNMFMPSGKKTALSEPLPVQNIQNSFPSLEQVISQHIRQALDLTKGKISGPGGAAELLGVNASTLRSRMAKTGIAFKKD
ncbi:MAG: sigma-54 interaction domain-containing protein [Mailhella sp.]